MGHGHVTPNPDGLLARCGGPAICPKCAIEKAALDRKLAEAEPRMSPAQKVANKLHDEFLKRGMIGGNR